MATVLFIVKATIPRKKEAAFNRWYNYKHCPQFLRYPGAVSARVYRQSGHWLFERREQCRRFSAGFESERNHGCTACDRAAAKLLLVGLCHGFLSHHAKAHARIWTAL